MHRLQQRISSLQQQKKSAEASNAKIDTAISELNAQIAKANENGDSETASALQKTVQQLSGAKVNTGDLKELEKVSVGEVMVNLPIPDFSSLQTSAAGMKAEFETIKTSVNGLVPTLRR